MWINVLTMTRKKEKNEPLSKQLSFEDEPKRMIEMITYLKRMEEILYQKLNTVTMTTIK